jgi:putative SOS response-associated peptidase YedK
MHWRDIVRLYRLTAREAPLGWTARYNLAPTQTAPVIRLNPETRERELVMMKWGLVPFWAKEPKVRYATINARAESVAEKPAYREAYKRRRCLIPASGYYEWPENAEDPKNKQPYLFTRGDGQPWTLAGIWERWQKGDQPALETFSIVVGDAPPQVERLHDRAPIILEPGDFDVWLDPDVGSQILTPLLKPWGGTFRIVPVSKKVNSVRNEGPDLVEPIAA